MSEIRKPLPAPPGTGSYAPAQGGYQPLPQPVAVPVPGTAAAAAAYYAKPLPQPANAQQQQQQPMYDPNLYGGYAPPPQYYYPPTAGGAYVPPTMFAAPGQNAYVYYAPQQLPQPQQQQSQQLQQQPPQQLGNAQALPQPQLPGEFGRQRANSDTLVHPAYAQPYQPPPQQQAQQQQFHPQQLQQQHQQQLQQLHQLQQLQMMGLPSPYPQNPMVAFPGALPPLPTRPSEQSQQQQQPLGHMPLPQLPQPPTQQFQQSQAIPPLNQQRPVGTAPAVAGGLPQRPQTARLAPTRTESFAYPSRVRASTGAAPGSLGPRGDGQPQVPTLPPDLAEDIHKFQFEGFAKQYFSTHKAGILRRKVSVEAMIRFTPEPITRPLLKLQNPAHNKLAIRSFKLIQTFMSEEVNTELPSGLHTAREFVTMGLTTEQLRDEMYCQLCRQTNGNPDLVSALKGWQLMLITIESYLPTKNLENYIRKYIYDSITSPENANSKVPHFASYCFRRFNVLCKANRRARLPTDGEIRRAKNAPFMPTPFGVTLQDIMADPRMVSQQDPSLPAILTFCVSAVIDYGGFNTEGIFRISADLDVAYELRLQMENGVYDRSQSKSKDPHVFANVLKMWLGELSDPVIPRSLYDHFISNVGNPAQLKSLVHKNLPETNRRVLFYLVKFLRNLARPENQAKTKMSMGNLAVVFSPNIFRCPYDNPLTIIENTKTESEITLELLKSLEVQ